MSTACTLNQTAVVVLVIGLIAIIIALYAISAASNSLSKNLTKVLELGYPLQSKARGWEIAIRVSLAVATLSTLILVLFIFWRV